MDQKEEVENQEEAHQILEVGDHLGSLEGTVGRDGSQAYRVAWVAFLQAFQEAAYHRASVGLPWMAEAYLPLEASYPFHVQRAYHDRVQGQA